MLLLFPLRLHSGISNLFRRGMVPDSGRDRQVQPWKCGGNAWLGSSSPGREFMAYASDMVLCINKCSGPTTLDTPGQHCLP